MLMAPITSLSAAAGWVAAAVAAGVSLDCRPDRYSTVRLVHAATWTVLHHDGPNHLGLWYNVLPEHQMGLITSGPCHQREPTARGVRGPGGGGLR